MTAPVVVWDLHRAVVDGKSRCYIARYEENRGRTLYLVEEDLISVANNDYRFYGTDGNDIYAYSLYTKFRKISKFVMPIKWRPLTSVCTIDDNVLIVCGRYWFILFTVSSQAGEITPHIAWHTGCIHRLWPHHRGFTTIESKFGQMFGTTTYKYELDNRTMRLIRKSNDGETGIDVTTDGRSVRLGSTEEDGKTLFVVNDHEGRESTIEIDTGDVGKIWMIEGALCWTDEGRNHCVKRDPVFDSKMTFPSLVDLCVPLSKSHPSIDMLTADLKVRVDEVFD